MEQPGSEVTRPSDREVVMALLLGLDFHPGVEVLLFQKAFLTNFESKHAIHC